MTASIMIPPKIQFIDANGQPYVGGFVYTYEAGTSTPKASYTDYSATVQNPNPVILDAAGSAFIWLKGAYKIVVTKANGDPGYTADNVISYTSYNFDGLTATVDDLNSTTTVGVFIDNDYSVVLGDRGKTLLVDAASVATPPTLFITLPDVDDVPNKFKICIKKIDFSSNNIKFLTPTGQYIDGISNYTLYDYGDFIEILADGSQWRIVASQERGSVITLTTNKTLDLSYHGKTIYCDTSAGAITLTLPSIASLGKGFTFNVKGGADLGTHNVVINANSPDTIDGDSSLTLNVAYEAYTLKSGSSLWFVLNSELPSHTFATGDNKISDNPNQPGWLCFTNDSWTIGSTTSGAHFATNDAKNLFLLWYAQYNDSLCPVSGGRTGNALNDWNANKTMRIYPLCGRVIGIVGTGTGLTARAAGDFVGEEGHALNSNENGWHTHDYVDLSAGGWNYLGNGTTTFSSSGAGHFGYGGTAFPISAGGNSAKHNTIQPTLFKYFLVKL